MSQKFQRKREVAFSINILHSIAEFKSILKHILRQSYGAPILKSKSQFGYKSNGF